MKGYKLVDNACVADMFSTVRSPGRGEKSRRAYKAAEVKHGRLRGFFSVYFGVFSKHFPCELDVGYNTVYRSHCTRRCRDKVVCH